jgi:two-component system response regulator CpxR
MESILIIDDDIALCSMLRDYFALHEMDLAMSHDGLSGLDTVLRGRFDLILLDVMLPGIDGFDILRHLRPVSDVSVLLLTSRGEVGDRILGLENGADDYLSKPFDPRELVARVRAILRRRKPPSTQSGPGKIARKFSISGFEMDTAACSVQYREIPLALTEIEFALLEALLESPGVVLSREQLVDRIFQRPFHPLDRSLDMLVSRLRHKLEIEDNPGAAIRTVRNSGYVFSVPLDQLSRRPIERG